MERAQRLIVRRCRAYCGHAGAGLGREDPNAAAVHGSAFPGAPRGAFWAEAAPPGLGVVSAALVPLGRAAPACQVAGLLPASAA